MAPRVDVRLPDAISAARRAPPDMQEGATPHAHDDARPRHHRQHARIRCYRPRERNARATNTAAVSHDVVHHTIGRAANALHSATTTPSASSVRAIPHGRSGNARRTPTTHAGARPTAL